MITTTQHVTRCQILALPSASLDETEMFELRRQAKAAGCTFVSSLSLTMARAARAKATANTNGDGPEAA